MIGVDKKSVETNKKQVERLRKEAERRKRTYDEMQSLSKFGKNSLSHLPLRYYLFSI